MKRTILLGALVLPALFFFACNNAGTAAGAGSPDSTGAVSDPNKYHGGGHPVPWAQIQTCITAYADTMARYGITADSPRQKISKCPDSTYMITTSEYFRADSLMSFLKEQIQKYDPQGKGANMNFVIYPGIRTGPMLTGAGVAATTAGRITFFIVPDTTGPGLKGKALPKGGGGGDGYEVGGIQP
jgi:hypothetical protein